VQSIFSSFLSSENVSVVAVHLSDCPLCDGRELSQMGTSMINNVYEDYDNMIGKPLLNVRTARGLLIITVEYGPLYNEKALLFSGRYFK